MACASSWQKPCREREREREKVKAEEMANDLLKQLAEALEKKKAKAVEMANGLPR